MVQTNNLSHAEAWKIIEVARGELGKRQGGTAVCTIHHHIITMPGTGAAYPCYSLHHFPFVDDFFATLVTDDPCPGAADDLADRYVDLHLLANEELFIRYPLVAEQVAFPPVLGFGGISRGQLAGMGGGGKAHGRFRAGVYKGGCHFTKILYAHSAPPHPTVGGYRNAIGKTAIRFHNGQQPLVGLGQFQRQ